MANIKVRDDGPLLVDGNDISVVDAEGNAFTIDRRPFALCRCGHSNKKPFCDGAHNAKEFQAPDRAPTDV